MPRENLGFIRPCRCALPTNCVREQSSWTGTPTATANTRTRSMTCCARSRRWWRWLPSTKPTWTSPEQGGFMAGLDEAFLEQHFGKWGLALAGKSRGLDAGGWYDTEIGEDTGPKSISHEHTFDEDTAELARLESTLARLCEMVGRRLRENKLHARTIQLKLRYSDFSTITRAHSVTRATQLDTELCDEIRQLFHANWKQGATVRLL